jgi:hypothetical protein
MSGYNPSHLRPQLGRLQYDSSSSLFKTTQDGFLQMVSSKGSAVQLNSQQPSSLYRVILCKVLSLHKGNAIALKNDIYIDQ